MDFAAVEAQYNQIQAEYDKSINYAKLSSYRLQVIYDYFTSLISTYNNYKKLPRIKTTKDETKSNSIGCLGRQNVHFSYFVEFSEMIKNQQTSMYDFLTTTIIEVLKNLIDQRENFIEEIRKNVSEACKKRNNLLSEIKKLYSNYASLAKSIEKQYVKLSKTTDQKLLAKLQADFTASITSYSNHASRISSTIQFFNSANQFYMSQVIAAKQTIYNQEPQRLVVVQQLLQQIVPTFQQSSSLYNQFIQKISSCPVTWESEFLEFINANKIVRFEMTPKHFQSFPLTFDDPQFTIEIIYPHACIDFPLYIAEVINDCTDNSEKYHLKVRKGEFLFLFDSPNQKFVLAKNPKDGTKGYVPTDVLQVSQRKTVLVKAPQLKLSKDDLEVQTGEMLFLISEKDDMFMCENVFGDKGNVRSEFIFMDNI
ncbi:SH3 domain containing protein [Histomonas meleagridis]|uniref:SH3 domain containing protein n=1 Tax=Histomonas meleagridis TaxID=135588 RepID=UPI00355A7CF6|nr:SH3 domain containing protein [Histomonas meleagridis]KAH0807059.1 SH3 domain containing protein [Histomonas meleagridis]